MYQEKERTLLEARLPWIFGIAAGAYALLLLVSVVLFATGAVNNRALVGILTAALVSFVALMLTLAICAIVCKSRERAVGNQTTMNERDTQQLSKKQKVVKVFSMILLYAFLIVMALAVLFPFYFMLISSVKTLTEYQRAEFPQSMWPQKFVFKNYADAFTEANLGTLFMNTLYVGLVSTVLSLIITVISAFAFARLEFRGKNALFAALLGTMMIPGELFTITNYITVSDLGWKNTYTVLIVPFLVSVFYIYLLRQNFLQIPNELYLAAKVDGTSDLKYLWKVMIPLALPTLISITILKMMGAWNSYVWPRLVANDEAHQMITNGLRNAYTASTGDVNIPVQMAAVAIVSFPLFLVFVFLRKYIMKGVSRSGIKG